MNTEQERAKFEAWHRLHHGSLDVYGRDASGEYADKQVQGAFNVWQARAALAAPPADEELRRDAERYREALVRIKAVLLAANEMDQGPICDTIWMPGGNETLFDFIDGALAAEKKESPHD